jgi:hypothetical protein
MFFSDVVLSLQPTIFVSSFTLPNIDSVMLFEVVLSSFSDCNSSYTANSNGVENPSFFLCFSVSSALESSNVV